MSSSSVGVVLPRLRALKTIRSIKCLRTSSPTTTPTPAPVYTDSQTAGKQLEKSWRSMQIPTKLTIRPQRVVEWRRPITLWVALGGMLPIGRGRESFPSALL